MRRSNRSNEQKHARERNHDRENNYDDIIDLPRHVSRKRPQMPIEDRAAQFAPFAAVVGHNTSVKEAARITDEKRELVEAEKAVINEQLNEVQSLIQAQAEAQIQDQKQCSVEVEIEHFQADGLKTGGKYIVSKGKVEKIDVYTRNIIMASGEVIAIEDVFRLIVD